MPDVSVTKEIPTSADQLWAMVADLPRMGEWSPENDGGAWIGGATGPGVGAKFKGRNHHGSRRWSTIATVVDCEPGSRFSFRVSVLGLSVSDWSYDVEPTEAGCTVTASWSDRRPGFFKPIGRLATGVADRESHNRAGLEATLDALAAACGE
jgi:hypothetical protein